MSRRILRLRTRRDGNEPEILRALHDVGAVAWQLDRPCDLLVGYQGLFRTYEIKLPSEREKLSPAERSHRDTCAYHHLPHHVVTSVEEVLASLGIGAR